MIVKGHVDGQQVSQILLDTGATQTIVNMKWVKDEQLTKIVLVQNRIHRVHDFPAAA